MGATFSSPLSIEPEVSPSDVIISTVEALHQEGVTDVFTNQDQTILLTALSATSSINTHTFLVHSGDLHAAIGYAMATGLPGVCMTSLISDGLTKRFIHGMAYAYEKNIPLVLVVMVVDGSKKITAEGCVDRRLDEKIKCRFHIASSKDIRMIVRKALFVARSGRPGPVLIDYVSDDTVVNTDDKEELLICPPPPQLPPPEPTRAQLEKVIGLLRESKRPLLYVGSGCFEWRNELTRFVELTGIPVLKAAARSDTPVYLTDGDFKLRSYREPYNRFSVENFDLLLALDVESYYDGILDLRRSDSVILEFHDREEEEEEAIDEMTFLDRNDVQPGSVSSLRCGDTKSLLERLNHLLEEGSVGSGLDFYTWRREIDADRCWKPKRPARSVPFSYYFRDVVNEVANRGDTFIFSDDKGYRVRFWDWFTRGITSPWDIFEMRIDNCMMMRLSIAAGAAIGKAGGRRGTRTRCNGGGAEEDGQEEEIIRNNIIHVLHDLDDFTIEEFEILKRENLPLKVVIFNDVFSLRYKSKSTGTHLVDLVESLEIPCRRIARKEGVRDALTVMMETPGPYVLDIIVFDYVVDEQVERRAREIHDELSFYLL